MSEVSYKGMGQGNNPASHNIGTVTNRKPSQGVNNHLPDGYHNDTDPRYILAKEKPVHRLMAYMHANGFTFAEIAKATEYNAAHVSTVLKQPFMRVLIQNEQRDMSGDFRKEIVNAGQAAFQRIIELSQEARSETVKADLSKYLVDRYLGRPTQPVETVGKPASELTDDELKEAIGTVLGEGGETKRITFDDMSPSEPSAPPTSSLHEDVHLYDS